MGIASYVFWLWWSVSCLGWKQPRNPKQTRTLEKLKSNSNICFCSQIFLVGRSLSFENSHPDSCLKIEFTYLYVTQYYKSCKLLNFLRDDLETFNFETGAISRYWDIWFWSVREKVWRDEDWIIVIPIFFILYLEYY